MGWVLLAVGAAAVVVAVAVLCRSGRVHRNPGGGVYRQHSRADKVERPHRDVAHYHASGALPRWDP